jgi:hypothetical protein
MEENTFLYGYMKSQGLQSAYVGFTRDVAQPGVWRWVNGGTSTFTNWGPGEPNNARGQENYAEFYWEYPDGTWNDGDFGVSTLGDNGAFICEWAK